MPIMTTAEVKAILRLTDSTYDSDIETFLPYVEDDILDCLNNGFQDGYVYRESASDLAFVRGDSDTADRITDRDAEFLENGFRDDMDIVISGGGTNYGLYHVTSASTDQLLLTEYGELIPQDQSDTKDDNPIGLVRISRVNWPNALRLPVAKMVWHLIQDARPDDAQSETIGDYSITYVGGNAYPEKVVRMLDKFRQVRMR